MKPLRRITNKELKYSLVSAVHLVAGIILIAGDNSAGWIFLILSSFWIIISRKTV
jgi:hypothetical protein